MPAKEDVPPSCDTDSTIHIDAKSRPFYVLLNCITGVLPSHREHLFDILNALEVGDRFGFTQLPRVVLPFMPAYAESEPYLVFKFAAE
jgi:hypothetical protein